MAPVEQPQQTSRSATRTSTAAAAATSSAPRQAASGSIVDIARSLLGIYYVYGGTTPAGFDCSGFTQYVYAHAGISIPRTATAQMNAATIVSNPQPGDLVFTVSGGIATHVGIYTGPGMMIDSPRTGKATSERAIFSGNVYGRF
ncbi:Protein p60 (fragment) [Phycicoccus elongatus Lp2]|uniref:Protein p60 n=1 Tax=Phycicoccus elongatus Lp2 TaxID=1193181 RepID=N0DXD5_9MICO